MLAIDGPQAREYAKLYVELNTIDHTHSPKHAMQGNLPIPLGPPLWRLLMSSEGIYDSYTLWRRAQKVNTWPAAKRAIANIVAAAVVQPINHEIGM